MKKIAKMSLALATCFVLALAGIVMLTGTNVNGWFNAENNEQGIVTDISLLDGTGAGTYLDPFLIGSFDVLNRTTAGVNRGFRTLATTQGMHFRLIADIDMSGRGNWVPIPSLALNSVFDGDGFTLNGLTRTGASGAFGFFNNLQGTVRNLNFENVNINGSAVTGVLASEIGGSLGTNTVLVENVHMISGGIGITSAATGRTGGFVGRVTASGTSTTARANIIFRNSSNTMQMVRGGNCTGGFLGIVESGGNNLNISILNSMTESHIWATSNIAGTFVGGTSGGSARTWLLENLLGIGIVHAQGSHSGGIFGYIAGTNEVVTIRNTVSDVTLTSTSLPRGGIFGSAMNAAQAALITVENSWFNSDNFNAQVNATNAVSGTGTGGVLPQNQATSGTATTQEMQTQQFIDRLNAGQTPPPWTRDENGRPIPSFFARSIQITFNANGGEFVGEGSTYTYTLQNEGDTISTIPNINRIGYNLIGWDTQSNGEGERFATIANIPTDEHLAVYAIWERIEYQFRTITGPNQTQIQLRNEGGAVIPSPTFTINQPGHMTVSLATSAPYHFVSWQALSNEWTGVAAAATDNYWINIGAGDTHGEAALVGRRLDLVTTENDVDTFLINEEFITRFVREEGGLGVTFRAIYTNVAPISVTFDAINVGQRAFGSINIDGIGIPFGPAPRFYNAADNHTISIEITPNRFRTVALVEMSSDGGVTWNTMTYTESNRIWSTELDLTGWWSGVNFEVRVTFGVERFGISVVTNMDTEMSTAQRNAAVMGTPSHTSGAVSGIGLGDTFTGITLNSVQGFRLVHNNINNVRILNQRTGHYDHFHATNGVISLPTMDSINETFLENYLDNNGNITIVAIFVRQFGLVLDADLAMIEDFNIIVTETNGFRHMVGLSALATLDEGAIVRIALETRDDVVLGEITVTGGSEYTIDGSVIVLTITGHMVVDITFELREYVIITPIAIDVDDNQINNINIDTTINGLATTAYDLVDGDEISMTLNYDDQEFMFMGWFAIRGNDMIALDYVDHSDNSLTFIFNTAFINDYVHNFELRIVARFATIHSVNFNVTGNGGFRAYVLENSAWVHNTTFNATEANRTISVNFAENAIVRIEAIEPTSGDPFDFNGFDGLAGETPAANIVEITVSGLRFITVNFVPRPIAITITSNLNNAMGTFNDRSETLTIGDTVVLTFNPQSGFELSSWTINGRTIAQIQSEFGNVVQSGNTVLLTFTHAWYISEHGGSNIHSNVTTTMNRLFMVGMLIALIAIPLIVFFVAWIMISNSRKKKQYAVLVAKRQQGSVMMGQGEALKKLREDMDNQ